MCARVFDIKWATPEAQGAFYGGYGDIHISRKAIILKSSASSFKLLTKIRTTYPPIVQKRGQRSLEFKPAVLPKIDGVDVDLHLNGFDLMGMHPLRFDDVASSPQSMHMKLFGKLKFNGRVPDSKRASKGDSQSEIDLEINNKVRGMVGEVSLVGLKLNQFLVAPNLFGSLDISSTSLKVSLLGICTTENKLVLDYPFKAMELLVGSWSPMFSYWLVGIQNE